MKPLQIVCLSEVLAAEMAPGLLAALDQAHPQMHIHGASDEFQADVALLALGTADELLAWLQARQGWHLSPLSWLGPAQPTWPAEPLLQLGLTGWWPLETAGAAAASPVPAWLPQALALDEARWQEQQTRQTQLVQLRTQMDERKWVDRAKGLLMSAQGMPEDEAFRLLRSTAMHANLRLGEVSRSVIEAAQWADGINRAGQLRMLSQRLVKLAAQRLLGVDARRARTQQHQATQRVQANLAHLASLLPVQQGVAALQEALAAVTRTWAVLHAALEQRQTPASLLEADTRAEELLTAAEALTGALDAHGARRALHIVNLCGRQRMRCQRLAKEALLTALPGQVARVQEIGRLLDDFEAALLELERAPLSTPETRSMLAQARDEWLRLLRGLRSAEGDEGRAALAGSADALLDLFDRLTEAYEHSLQVLMA